MFYTGFGVDVCPGAHLSQCAAIKLPVHIALSLVVM